MKYPLLFSPCNVGNITIKNRVVMTAAGSCLLEKDGSPNLREAAYFAARAEGGVGLIITGITCINEKNGVFSPIQTSAATDAAIPNLARLADAVHPYGAKIFVQLQHPGNTGRRALNGGAPVMSPSGISMPGGDEAREMTIAEIHTMVEDFAAAAYRAKLAGMDGVEIHAAHFYMLHQFLSPTFNHRQDEYGGCLENRFRALAEVVAAVRHTCGKDFPLAVRVSVEEYIGENGYHMDEGIKICKMLEDIGVDLLDVSCSGSASKRGLSVEPVSCPQGWRKSMVTAVKKSVKIPTIGVTVIRDPAFAEQMLREGRTDFVGSARCHLADSRWSNKAREGRDEEIRKCISCIRCLDEVKSGKSVACSVNPLCGRETEAAPLVRDGNDRCVVVLGAGPGGMEAAKNLANRGFRVVLFEKQKVAGGQVWLAAQVPHKDKMNWLIDSQLEDCRRAGVVLRFGKAPDLTELAAEHPYAIVDATGAVPLIPRSIEIDASANVTTAESVLRGEVTPVGESIAVIGSGMTGLETAEYLTRRDNFVTIVEQAETIAPGANVAAKTDVTMRLDVACAVFMLGRRVDKISADSVYMTDVRTGESYEYPCDRVVLSLGVKPGGAYAREELLTVCDKVYAIGDAVKGGRILEAIRQGYDCAAAL